MGPDQQDRNKKKQISPTALKILLDYFDERNYLASQDLPLLVQKCKLSPLSISQWFRQQRKLVKDAYRVLTGQK